MTTFDEARNARLAAARELAVYRSLANDLHAEWKAFDEAVESKAIRYVKTPKGAEFYDQPIGSPIRPGGGKLSYIRNGPKKKRTSTGAASGSSAATPEKETPSKPRIDYTRRTPKASAGEPETPSRPNPASSASPKPVADSRYGTDKEVNGEIDRLIGLPKRSKEEQTRLDGLLGEYNRRNPKRPTQPQVVSGGDSRYGSDKDIAKELNRLSKKRNLSREEQARLLALRLESNRRAAGAANDQARRLVGKSDEVTDIRFATDFKVYNTVGDGDWDCSHMTDDDLDWFLGKALTGRPTVEKLQQANSMLTEKLARVDTTEPEVKELTWEPDVKDAMHDPKGGLSAEGRAQFNAQGSNLKPGVTKYDEASDADKRRWVRWCLRFAKTPRPLKDDKGEPTNYALMFRAWGRPVPQTADDVRATYNLGLKRRDTLGMSDGKKDDVDEFADWDSLLS